ncbi:MAG: molybdopterin molybdotransferase MoeA [Desulfofustis sp.]|nr:molybdopterin molybdotransferase MoeA [Desulfofustis sp.]
MTAQSAPLDMLGRAQLTAVAEARSRLLSHIGEIKPGVQRLPLEKCLDRVCASQVVSPEDLPPTDRSTMDGFAVIAADTFGASQSMPGYLDIRGEVVMGEVPAGKISRGTCFKIPTGGLLPAGADAVVMHEHTVPVDSEVVEIIKPVGSGANLIKQGDDIRKGAVAVERGQLLRPQELGLLAGLGISEVEVYAPLEIGVISTGDEIVDYREIVSPGKIRDINSIVLSSLVRRCGALVHDYGIVSDDENTFFSIVEEAVTENNLVLFSGGSSVGMRDLGEQAIERIGNPGILVHGVSLKPGKPVIIGLCDGTPVFGLPGHPVSAMVCFDFFVRPAIEILSGITPVSTINQPSVQARLKRNINSAAGRLDVVRVQLELEGDVLQARPILGKSGAISTLSQAHGYFLIDEDSQGVSSDDTVDVYLYP